MLILSIFVSNSQDWSWVFFIAKFTRPLGIHINVYDILIHNFLSQHLIYEAPYNDILCLAHHISLLWLCSVVWHYRPMFQCLHTLMLNKNCFHLQDVKFGTRGSHLLWIHTLCKKKKTTRTKIWSKYQLQPTTNQSQETTTYIDLIKPKNNMINIIKSIRTTHQKFAYFSQTTPTFGI